MVRNYLHRINVNEIVEEGNHFRRINDYQKALETYYKAFKVDPNCVTALLGAAEVYLEEKKISEAMNIFDRLIEMDSLYAEDYKHDLNHLAINLEKHDQHDKAIFLYKKAIKMDPKDEVLYFNLASAFIREKHFNEAKELLKKALELDSSFKEAKELLGKLPESV